MLIAVVASASGGAPAQTLPTAAAQSPTGTQVIDVQGGKIRVVTVATGLVHPWSLAFLPDGKTLLVAEAGRIRVIHGDTLDAAPAYTVPAGTSKENNDGLKWIALHPKFADNKRSRWTSSRGSRRSCRRRGAADA